MGLNKTPLPLAGGAGGGQTKQMPDWKPRNTQRARDLRKTATPAERHLWQYLSRSQLDAKFSRQMPLGPFYADFLCRTRKLVIELDGHSHDIATERDVARDAWLQEQGYRVLHFTNAEVMENVEGVVLTIKAAVHEGSGQP